MRLLIFTAAIAVVLAAYGVRIERMQTEVRQHHAYVVEHQAELGSRIEDLERAVLMEGGVVWSHSSQLDELNYYIYESRLDELNCVHYVYEDGSAVHLDAEIAHECLRRQLGWP